MSEEKEQQEINLPPYILEAYLEYITPQVRIYETLTEIATEVENQNRDE